MATEPLVDSGDSRMNKLGATVGPKKSKGPKEMSFLHGFPVAMDIDLL